MPFRDEPLGTIAPKVHSTWFEKFLSVVMVLILLLLFTNFRQNAKLQKVQAEGVVRGYILRATICDLYKAIGASEPNHCDDKVIQPYRDRNLTVASTAGARASKHTLDVMCEVLLESKPTDQIKSLCQGS